MSYQRFVPDTESELMSILKQLHAGQHAKSFAVRDNRFEVDLDFRANLSRPDFYMPLRKAKVKDASDLAYTLFRYPPTYSDARNLFDCIDPHGL